MLLGVSHGNVEVFLDEDHGREATRGSSSLGLFLNFVILLSLLLCINLWLFHSRLLLPLVGNLMMFLFDKVVLHFDGWIASTTSILYGQGFERDRIACPLCTVTPQTSHLLGHYTLTLLQAAEATTACQVDRTVQNLIRLLLRFNLTTCYYKTEKTHAKVRALLKNQKLEKMEMILGVGHTESFEEQKTWLG